MLTLGLAASYAPAMFREPAEWGKVHDWLVADVAQPPELAKETPDLLEEHAGRVRRAFDALRESLAQARAEALVVLASDTGRVFTGVQVPQMCTFLGDEFWGSTRFSELGEPADGDIIRLRCSPGLAAFVQRELVTKGFDMSYSQNLKPLGQPDYGSSPAFVEPARALFSNLDIPIVPIHINTQVTPAPSGHRCYAFGQAVAEVLQERPERIALLAAGGLSHDHHHDRAGYVDEPLDRWVLDQLARGRGTAVKGMFDLESDALRGGAAHVRLWTAVAGACESLGAKAEVVDYFPSYTAATGLGFVQWTIPG